MTGWLGALQALYLVVAPPALVLYGVCIYGPVVDWRTERRRAKAAESFAGRMLLAELARRQAARGHAPA